MLEYMLMPLRRYAQFSGRSRRMEYWSFTLFITIIVFVLMGVMFGTGAATGAFSNLESGDPSALMGVMFGGFGLVILLFWLAILVPSIAVTVRRLHDRDMSGWWYLGFMVLGMIPFVGWIASIVFLVLLFLPGTVGPNRFGDDPKDPSGAEIFA